MQFALTVKAKNDLKSIALYTQKNWGNAQQRIYIKLMDDAFHLIAKDPNCGIPANNIRKGYSKYRVGKHLVFFRQYNNEIQIVRILHERMDIPGRLKGRV